MPSIPKPTRPAYIPAPPVKEGTGNQEFYNRQDWRTVSRLYREENPLCEACKFEGKLKECSVTDHIIPLPDGQDKDTRNFMALCHWHHNRKRALEKNGFCLPHLNGIPVNREEIFKHICRII